MNLNKYQSISRVVVVIVVAVVFPYVASARDFIIRDVTNANNVFFSVIGATGKVGIGTSTPAYKLDVWGTGSFTQPVIVGTPTASGHATTKSYVDSAVTGGGGVGAFTTLTSSATTTLASSGGNFSVGTSKLFVDGVSGSVGIGTTGPGARLHSVATTEQLRLGYDASSYSQFTVADGGHLTVQTYGSSGVAGDLFLKAAGSAFIDFDTDGGSSGEVFRIRANQGSGLADLVTFKRDGNVGIGTTGPLEKLYVQGASNATDIEWAAALKNPNNTISGAYGVGLKLRNGDVSEPGKWAGIASVAESGWSNLTGLALYTSQTEKVRITNAGNVGIGTTGPQYKVSGVQGYTNVKTMIVSGTDDDGLVIGNSLAGGSNFFGFSQLNAGSEQVVTSAIIGEMTDTTDGSEKGTISFHTKTAGGYISPRMTILDTGNVGIATTTPAYTLTTVGTGYFSQPVIVGTPTAVSHAATKSYVDSAAGSGLTGAGTTNYLAKWTSGTSLSTTTIYETAGNVGIGTTGPASRLDVADTNPILTLTANAGGFSRTSKIDLGGTFPSTDSSARNVGNIQAGFSAYSWESSYINFQTRNAGSALVDAMRITNAGNVGIGTTAPSTLLHLKAGTTSPIITGDYVGAGSFGTINLYEYGTGLMKIQSGSGYNLALEPTGGNVGIGTTNPTSTLQVAGTFRASMGGGDVFLDSSGNFIIQL